MFALHLGLPVGMLVRRQNPDVVWTRSEEPRVKHTTMNYCVRIDGGRPDGGAIFDVFGQASAQRWFDQGSGRYDEPPAEASGGAGLRRYHGYR